MNSKFNFIFAVIFLYAPFSFSVQQDSKELKACETLWKLSKENSFVFKQAEKHFAELNNQGLDIGDCLKIIGEEKVNKAKVQLLQSIGLTDDERNGFPRPDYRPPAVLPDECMCEGPPEECVYIKGLIKKIGMGMPHRIVLMDSDNEFNAAVFQSGLGGKHILELLYSFRMKKEVSLLGILTHELTHMTYADSWVGKAFMLNIKKPRYKKQIKEQNEKQIREQAFKCMRAIEKRADFGVGVASWKLNLPLVVTQFKYFHRASVEIEDTILFKAFYSFLPTHPLYSKRAKYFKRMHQLIEAQKWHTQQQHAKTSAFQEAVKRWVNYLRQQF